MTALAIVLWLAACEAIAQVALANGQPGWAAVAAGFSPWQAMLEAVRPYPAVVPELGKIGSPVWLFLIVASGVTLLLNGVAILRLRRWNPSQEAGRAVQPEEDEREAAPSAAT